MFDAWDEGFSYERWCSVFERAGIDPAFYANRAFGTDEVLPWDIIDCGVTKEFFLRERAKAYEAATTPNCRQSCSGCGANRLGGERAVCPGCQSATNQAAEPFTLPTRNEWPPLETPKMIRIKFRKVGDLQYISHLDLQRTLARVLVRAKIPMWYTQGFNPHAKVVFGLPLSVGTESECEFIDLRVDRDIPPAELKKQLNRELTADMQILEAYEPTTKFQDVAWAKYEIALQAPSLNAEVASKLQALYTTAPLTMTKKTKSGEREIDIIPMIRKIHVVYNEDRPGEIRISAVLSAGSNEHLNPELLIKAARDRLGVLTGNPTEELYSILRTHVYLDDAKTEFR